VGKLDKGKHASILVVDDDPGVLRATSKLLDHYGYHVVASSNAEDAVSKLEANRIDVVVSDIVMPMNSGIDLLKKVHTIDPQIPVILMTAYADMEKVIEAIKMGAFDFIIKPVNIDLFIHSVGKATSYKNMLQMEKDYKDLLEEFNYEIETLVAERTMSLIALTMADKIRNPASVIGLTCKRILDKEHDPEELRAKLGNIISETDKLERLVKDFETLLKNRRSKFAYQDINENVKGAVSIIKNKASGKGVDLVLNLSTHPLKTNIQKNLMQIAISHILKNSIEATPEGGGVTVSTGKDQDNILLTIADTGHGISKKDSDRIFDPMFSTKKQRFGMGLSIVKQIVSEHMGEIDVESDTGKGTTFRIKLPVRWIENNT
jgi:signal transduction histidine kinase